MKIEKVPVKCPYCDHINYFSPEGYGAELQSCETEDGGCGSYFVCKLTADESAEEGMLTYKTHAALVSFVHGQCDIDMTALLKLSRNVPEGYSAHIDYSGHIDQLNVQVYFEFKDIEGSWGVRNQVIYNNAIYLNKKDPEAISAYFFDVIKTLTNLPPGGPTMAEEVA